MRWHFNSSNTIEDVIFNPILERFFKYGVQGLVRENIQNSLDARLDSNQPVIVEINTGNHTKGDIPLFDTISGRIKSLTGGNEYTRETIKDMIAHLDDSKFGYISFEDENTKGLTGSRYGYPYDPGCNYNAYAYTKGLHVEDSDRALEGKRGGSHGVGKIASNAASYFYTMFFANCDEFGVQTLGGTIQLIDHKFENAIYRSTGYFVGGANDRFEALINRDFSQIFTKNNRGLKIVVPFFRSQFNDEREIIKTVVDSFLIALKNDSLICRVNGYEISKNTVDDIIQNPTYFDESDIDNDKYFTKLYNKTLLTPYNEQITIRMKQNDYRFNLYLTVDENISNGRTGIFRTVGMKIEDRKIHGYSQKPYNAVLISDNSDCDTFLKSLENESHKKLDYEHFKNNELREDAKKFLSLLNTEMRRIIDLETRKLYPDEEKMDTQDILFELDNTFKHELDKKYSPINIGGKEEPRIILKVNPTPEEGESAGKKGKRNGQGDFPYKRVKKTFGDKGIKSYVQVPNSLVKRIQIGNVEKLIINLPEFDKITDSNNYNLLISVVDGMGEEMTKELHLNNTYYSIKDEISGKNLLLDMYSIKNIEVKDSKSSLSLNIREQNIKYYKFKYYIEV
jgi:hypothetical protein